MKLWMLISTPGGLEDVASSEVSRFARNVSVLDTGLIRAEGDEHSVARLNIWGRTFTRVLIGVCEGELRDLNDVVREVYNAGDEVLKFFRDGHTFAVRCDRSGKHGFTSVDAAREVGGAIHRMALSAGLDVKVNLDSPTVEFVLKIRGDRFYLGVNSSGEGLNRRGYRVYSHPAALNPVIAAAMVMMLGWGGEDMLVDPMCGGATIPIEAAMIALNYAPGLYRGRHPLVDVPFIEPEVYWAERRRALESRRGPDRKVAYAIDISRKHLEGGIRNAESAGVRGAIEFIEGDSRRLTRYLERGSYWFATNPPYGIRMTRREALPSLYRGVLSSLREVGAERGAVITSETSVLEDAAQRSGYGIVEKRRVMHGNLETYVYILSL